MQNKTVIIKNLSLDAPHSKIFVRSKDFISGIVKLTGSALFNLKHLAEDPVVLNFVLNELIDVEAKDINGNPINTKIRSIRDFINDVSLDGYFLEIVLNNDGGYSYFISKDIVKEYVIYSELEIPNKSGANIFLLTENGKFLSDSIEKRLLARLKKLQTYYQLALVNKIEFCFLFWTFNLPRKTTTSQKRAISTYYSNLKIAIRSQTKRIKSEV